MTNIPDGMTAWKLREIANWLDTYDQMAEQYINLMCLDKSPVEVDELLAAVRGKEVQDDLRAWADAIDTERTN